MPLKTTGQPGTPNFDRKAIGFWMTAEGTDRPIRVFVSYEGLRQLDPSKPPDVPAALETFDDHRLMIEKAASDKAVT
jgi:hypothetical protein